MDEYIELNKLYTHAVNKVKEYVIHDNGIIRSQVDRYTILGYVSGLDTNMYPLVSVHVPRKIDQICETVDSLFDLSDRISIPTGIWFLECLYATRRKHRFHWASKKHKEAMQILYALGVSKINRVNR